MKRNVSHCSRFIFVKHARQFPVRNEIRKNITSKDIKSFICRLNSSSNKWHLTICIPSIF